MALIPVFQDTLFITITTTFEVWILFGIIIIMNSKSNMDSAMKCFVFFLISQPLVYLIQVPFSPQGWGLLGYYKYWFVWTVLRLPMGYIGYWMKKDKWWGYLILLPMIAMTAGSYSANFSDFLFSMPRYILISLFCAFAMIVYPLAVFENRKIKTVGTVISGIAVIVITIICLIVPQVYSTAIMSNGEEYRFDDSYTAYLEDGKYGNVEIQYDESIEDYLLRADFKKAGDTVLTLVSPDGEKEEYDLHIERTRYTITRRLPGKTSK